MRVLDLFSGIGGLSLGLERAGMTTVAFCEQDKFCQRILKRHWPEVPIYDDVRTIRDKFTGTADVICGGFPCQPFSVAGQQRGAEDDRFLWPEMLACIRHYRPTWVIGENVTGIVNMALDGVLSDLEGENYTCQTFIVPACAIGAPHRRDRVWIVGNSYGRRRKACAQHRDSDCTKAAGAPFGNGAPLADSDSAGCGKQWRPVTVRAEQPAPERDSGRQAESGLGGSTDGISAWLDGTWEDGLSRVTEGGKNWAARLRALGNAVVPQIPEIIGRAIMEISHAPRV